MPVVIEILIFFSNILHLSKIDHTN